ncbi:hypothetical protein [Allohahella marinimesophila]|uniref:Uncharacterized protein n=1 Tax=Allohahella marinimesophila TaxID=1054972 RepID=A0ABP7Q727_9GAMM
MIEICILDFDSRAAVTLAKELARLKYQAEVDHALYLSLVNRAVNAFRKEVSIYDLEKDLINIRSINKQRKFILLTVIPIYELIELDIHVYSQFVWDNILVYDYKLRKGLQRRKDIEATYRFIAEIVAKYNVQASGRVAVLGEDLEDIAVGYTAGAYVILNAIRWTQWSYQTSATAVGMTPDLVLTSIDQLAGFLENPKNYFPALEYLVANVRGPTVDICGLRYEQIPSEGPVIYSAGRFFPRDMSFQARRDSHLLTRCIISSRTDEHYKKAVLQTVVGFLNLNYPKLNKRDRQLIIAPILPRLVEGLSNSRFIEQVKEFDNSADQGFKIANNFRVESDTIFSSSSTNFPEDYPDVDESDLEAYYNNFDVDEQNVEGNTLIIVVELITSPRILVSLDRKLKKAGAKGVKWLALATTVNYPHSELARNRHLNSEQEL